MLDALLDHRRAGRAVGEESERLDDVFDALLHVTKRLLEGVRGFAVERQRPVWSSRQALAGCASCGVSSLLLTPTPAALSLRAALAVVLDAVRGLGVLGMDRFQVAVLVARDAAPGTVDEDGVERGPVPEPR